MRKSNDALHVWKPTGHRDGGNFHTVWAVLSSPVFFIAIAVLDVVAIVSFDMSRWWMWAIAPSALCLAIVAILLRHRASGRLFTSKRQAARCNKFGCAERWLPNRYINRIDMESKRTPKDDALANLLYRHLAEALVTLGLYDETGQSKIALFSGREFVLVRPIEFYTDFLLDAGTGYILLEPEISLISKIQSVDERIISRVLRNIGLTNWTVERVSFDDDLVLFVLQDEQVSRAYDFSAVE